MKVEERFKKLKELGFEQSSYNPAQLNNNQLDVSVYVDINGNITSVQICKSWHFGIQSYNFYHNYSNRDGYLIKVMKLLDEINRML